MDNTSFDETLLNSRFAFDAYDESVMTCCRDAARSPLGLYVFMQRYAHFNAYAGSSVARLASSIGLSRELFIEPQAVVVDESDRGLNVAAKIFEAAIDEHADRHQFNLPHRSLAQATLKAVGDFAHLSDEERNAHGKIPDWLRTVVDDLIASYQGQPGDVGSLLTAMGFHAASERLADIEYAAIDRVVRHEHDGVGFSQYLRERFGKVQHMGRAVSMWFWVGIHGQFDRHGVEADHFAAALDAIQNAILFRPEPPEVLVQFAIDGFQHFVELQQRLFAGIRSDLRALESGVDLARLGSPRETPVLEAADCPAPQS
jgi:hypothetical protein